jgi:hypothetical protein
MTCSIRSGVNPGLQPWEGDGIDVGFAFAGTDWKLDVALRDTAGGLVVVECKRTEDAVKQGDMLELVAKVDRLRQSLQIPVVGLLMATHDHQIGAVKVGQDGGIQPIVLPEGSAPPGFSMTTLRYHAGLDIKCRDLGVYIPPESVTVTDVVIAQLLDVQR